MPEAKYRLYRRANGTYYQEDNQTGAQISLRTKDNALHTKSCVRLTNLWPNQGSTLTLPAFI